MVTAFWMPSIIDGSLMRATPPSRRMSAGTRSSAMTAAAPASSAIFACSASTTSMMTPPFNISASPTFTRKPSSQFISLSFSNYRHSLHRAARFHRVDSLREDLDPAVHVPLVHARNRQPHVRAIFPLRVELVSGRDTHAACRRRLRHPPAREMPRQPQPEDRVAHLAAPP